VRCVSGLALQLIACSRTYQPAGRLFGAMRRPRSPRTATGRVIEDDGWEGHNGAVAGVGRRGAGPGLASGRKGSGARAWARAAGARLALLDLPAIDQGKGPGPRPQDASTDRHGREEIIDWIHGFHRILLRRKSHAALRRAAQGLLRGSLNSDRALSAAISAPKIPVWLNGPCRAWRGAGCCH